MLQLLFKGWRRWATTGFLMGVAAIVCELAGWYNAEIILGLGASVFFIAAAFSNMSEADNGR